MHKVMYGDLVKGCSKRYAVTDDEGRMVFQSHAKSECVAKAQELDGFEVTGNEADLALQRRSV